MKVRRTLRNVSILILIILLVVIVLVGILYLYPTVSSYFQTFFSEEALAQPRTIYEIVLDNANFSIVFISVLFAIISVAVGIITFWGTRQIDRLEACRDNYLKDLKAMELFKEEIRRNQALDGQLTIAKIFFTQENYSKAWEHIKFLPNSLSYEVPYYKARILVNKEKGGDTNLRAIELLNKALADPNLTDDGRVNIYSFMGRTCLNMKDYKQGLVFSNMAIKINYTSLATQNQKAICLRHLQRLDKAIEVLEKIITIDESFSYAHYNLACYYCQYLPQDVSYRKLVLEHLARAITLWSEFKVYAKDDLDFQSIKDDPDFIKLIEIKKAT